MEGPVRITVTSRSLFDGGAETLHFAGAGTLRPTAAGWDLPYTAACRENGAEALVTGSAYFKAADRAAFVKTLRA